MKLLELFPTGTTMKEYVTRAAKLRPESPNALSATKITADELRLSWSQPSSSSKSPMVDKWRVYTQRLGPAHLRFIDPLLEGLARNFHTNKQQKESLKNSIQSSIQTSIQNSNSSEIISATSIQDFPRVQATQGCIGSVGRTDRPIKTTRTFDSRTKT